MNLKFKTKNILWWIFAAAVVVMFAVWMKVNPAPEHIKDTNGDDNHTLQSITELDIIEQKMGTRGAFDKRETHFNFAGIDVSSGVVYSSKKFTGVHRLYSATLFKSSDIYVSLMEFEIKEGNFAFCILFDGEIVGQVTPNKDGVLSEFLIENVKKTGTLEYVIAGESASFSFVSNEEFD